MFDYAMAPLLASFLASLMCRFEGVRGFYKGITANVLKNAPAASVTFIVYENVLNMLKLARRKDT